MGEVIKFPQPQTEHEEPSIMYCTNCGVEMGRPNPSVPWPDACPNGCTPYCLQSWPKNMLIFDWGKTQPPIFP